MGNVKGVNVERPNIKLDNVSINTNEKPIDFTSLYNETVAVDAVNVNVNEISKIDAANLLQENGINYNADEIKSIESSGMFDENIVIKMNNGEKFTFLNVGPDLTLFSIKLSDGTTIYCDIPEETERNIKLDGDINSDVPLRGVTEIDVNGYKTNIYWVGDDVDFETFKNKIKDIRAGLKKLPNNVLSYILTRKPSFKGFYVGTLDSASRYDKINDADIAAFTATGYVFINVEHRISSISETIVHEMAHILDSYLGKNGYHSEEDATMISYYETYKQMIQQLPLEGYPAEGFPDGLPNVAEFYAESVAAYIEYPDELEALMPEVYDYIDNQFKNL